MNAAKKTWSEKMRTKDGYPKIVELPEAAARRFGGATMVVPAPENVRRLMSKPSRGKVLTVSELRGALARQFNVETACPLTTGIFIWVAANAAAELGDNQFPFWRTLKPKGELVAKYPGGVSRQKQLLEKEGAVVETRRGRMFVKDYENRLAPLSA